MLRTFKTALWNYFCKIPDPRTMDAMSMTVHDCIRLIQQEKASTRMQSNQERAKRPSE